MKTTNYEREHKDKKTPPKVAGLSGMVPLASITKIKQKYMTVKDLRELLAEAEDDMLVLIPVDNSVFDGCFQHPCINESGVVEACDNENLKTSRKDFVLVPCGFFEDSHGFEERLAN